jgi:putative acetyltransferase
MNMQSDRDVIIRSATNRDRQRVVALVFSILAEYGLPPDPDGKDTDLSDIEEHYIRAGGVFELLEDRAENLLGTYGLYPLDRATCELRKMYFIPRIRGRGLGREVLARAVEQARRLGFKVIVLETISVLREAIRLYTRFGFVPVPAAHISKRVDQAYMLKLSE